ncbi:Vacuolar-sorting protein SNF8 [Pseudolycoriella hygida]|uniref:Vacuolar-sorting protein SNF8 n=1 Tax=Pseudolycoriella hygida TaxID=35572 RepID=A0A9Q0RXM4_9DIPT|nr:Vacuolar-sorting protein SNF8 [Pseudolycoriella hygida]
MRRRAGVGAIHKQKVEAEKYKDKGIEIQDSQFEQMTKNMEVFRENLEEFAAKHKNEIKKNAQFRRQFQEMCAVIGVDPLASGKGFWSVLGMGDFYYELGVQVVEVCLAANHSTGGLMELEELRKRLVRARGQNAKHQEITNEDILIATKKLKIFGNGFVVYPIGRDRYMVQSIPGELSLHETSVLEVAAKQPEGCITEELLQKELNWNSFRSNQAIEKVVGSGLAWVDDQGEVKTYWFPSLFPGRTIQQR